ncbi:MAG: Maf family protein [Balneolaceae bacterium]
MKLVLASKSPRRAQLLTRLGLPFEQQSSNLDEIWNPEQSPEENVQRLAKEKAEEIVSNWSNALILGSDTTVVYGNQILGKPETVEDAARMLRMLSDSEHQVCTGVALLLTDSEGSILDTVQFCASTNVRFASLSDMDIDAYIATGSPMDKAGAYGIQDDAGALFVQEIHGDYYNVVGLPLQALYQQLKRHVPDFARSLWSSYASQRKFESS